MAFMGSYDFPHGGKIQMGNNLGSAFSQNMSLEHKT